MVIFVVSILENKTLIFNLFSHFGSPWVGRTRVKYHRCHLLLHLKPQIFITRSHTVTSKLNFSEKKWKQMARSLIFITFERAILFSEKILGLSKEVQWNFQCLLRLVWSQLWSTEPLYCTFAAMQRWTPQNAYVFFFQSDLTPCSCCIWFYPLHSHLPLSMDTCHYSLSRVVFQSV